MNSKRAFPAPGSLFPTPCFPCADDAHLGKEDSEVSSPCIYLVLGLILAWNLEIGVYELELLDVER